MPSGSDSARPPHDLERGAHEKRGCGAVISCQHHVGDDARDRHPAWPGQRPSPLVRRAARRADPRPRRGRGSDGARPRGRDGGGSRCGVRASCSSSSPTASPGAVLRLRHASSTRPGPRLSTTLRAGELRGLPLVVGGRSLGARVACRTVEPPVRSVSCASPSRCFHHAAKLRPRAAYPSWTP